MTDITKLRSSFGNDSEKWVNAIQHAKKVTMPSGVVKVKIQLADGTSSRVSIAQLQTVAEQFYNRGSSEVFDALSKLKKKKIQFEGDEFEPVPLSLFKKTKKRLEKSERVLTLSPRSKSRESEDDEMPMSISMYAKNKKAAKRVSSSDTFDLVSDEMRNDPKEMRRILMEKLHNLFWEVFPKDEFKDLKEFEKYSLKDKIVSITKGAHTSSQLEVAIEVFTALVDSKKLSSRKMRQIEEAMSSLKDKLKQFES
jgi:hypothetical protein